MANKDIIGRRGEELAAAHLQAHAWQIVDRNWRTAIGEIDIVAVRDGVIAVCEVKTRTSTRFGTALDAVGAVKLARLRQLAVEWRQAHAEVRGRLRIDVIAIQLDGRGVTTITHLEAADA